MYRRKDGSREPNGVLEESALFAMMGVLFARMDEQANREMLREGRSSAYAGYPAITEQQAIDAVDLAFARGWQIEVHANGDAAVDLIIGTVQEATARHGTADFRYPDLGRVDKRLQP